MTTRDRVAEFIARCEEAAGAAGERQGGPTMGSTADRVAAYISGRYPSNLARAEAEGPKGDDGRDLPWRLVNFVVAEAARERTGATG